MTCCLLWGQPSAEAPYSGESRRFGARQQAPSELGGEGGCCHAGLCIPPEGWGLRVFLAEQMDELLQRCFLHALKSCVRKADLPLLTSTLLGSHMFSCWYGGSGGRGQGGPLLLLGGWMGQGRWGSCLRSMMSKAGSGGLIWQILSFKSLNVSQWQDAEEMRLKFPRCCEPPSALVNLGQEVSWAACLSESANPLTLFWRVGGLDELESEEQSVGNLPPPKHKPPAEGVLLRVGNFWDFEAGLGASSQGVGAGWIWTCNQAS